MAFNERKGPVQIEVNTGSCGVSGGFTPQAMEGYLHMEGLLHIQNGLGEESVDGTQKRGPSGEEVASLT